MRCKDKNLLYENKNILPISMRKDTALYQALRVILNPVDEDCSLPPAVSYKEMITMCSQCSAYTTTTAEQTMSDIESFYENIQIEQSILINGPNNPTGAVWERKFKRNSRIAKDKNLYMRQKYTKNSIWRCIMYHINCHRRCRRSALWL